MAPGALIVILCAAALTVALTGATKPLSGIQFGQDGHWVLNAALGTVFHVDGASKYVDAAAPMPGAETGSQVVQGDTGGYVVGSSKVSEFGKSSLKVEDTKSIAERPVALEVTGGPYLVFRQAGTVMRLGKPAVTIPADGKLGAPVTTRERALWLHRIDRNALCELPKGADRLACPVAVPSGHSGVLTVASGRPSFVDTTTDAVREITPGGLGDPVSLGVDLPADALVASTDVGGKIAALDQHGKRLYLLDTAKPGNKQVDLPAGDYAGIASSGSVVALVDKENSKLVTYGSDGTKRAEQPIPGGAAPVPLAKGEDGRVYVDGANGAQVLVVDQDGAVSPVQAAGVGKKPEPGVPPVEPDPVKPDPGPGPKPEDTRKPRDTRKPEENRKPVAPPTAPASPPGAPGGVTATAGEGSATVKWSAANPNGAPITGYRISWPGGGKTVSGGSRSTRVTGLENGTSYVFTVEAINRAGTGSGASSAAVTPESAAEPPARPRGAVVSRGADTTADQCEPPVCAFMRIKLTGFTPGKTITVTAYTSDEGKHGSKTFTIGADGTLTKDAFSMGTPDRDVWVVADGVESNHFRWPSR